MTTPMTRGACPICFSADTTTRAHIGRVFVDLTCNQCGAWWRADAVTLRLVAYDADLDGDDHLAQLPTHDAEARAYQASQLGLFHDAGCICDQCTYGREAVVRAEDY